jgi:hypothetical protein
VVATTHTDGLGNYYFMDLPPGTYKVRATLPGFFKMFTTPSVYTVTLNLGDIVPDQNFGIAPFRLSGRDFPRFYQEPFTPFVQPNPFNPEATISFTLPQAMRVSMRIYDVEGRLVKTLLDENLPAGDHRLTWDGHDGMGQMAASGIYFLRTATPQGVSTQKLLLLK